VYLNSLNKNLNAVVAMMDNPYFEDEQGGYQAFNGTILVDDAFAKEVKEQATIKGKNTMQGSVAIWLDPYVNQGGTVVKNSALPSELKEIAKSTGQEINTNMVKAFNRIKSKFEQNGVKFGNGDNGTIRLEVLILSPSQQFPRSGKKELSNLRSNVVILKKPGV
jgi:hypothetical protein